MTRVRSWRGLLASLLVAALGLPVAAVWASPVSATSFINIGVAPPGATSPFDTLPAGSAGPSDVDGDGFFSAVANFGSGGGAAGSSRIDAATYWASVYAPNNHGQPVSSRGGRVEMELEKFYQKVSSDAIMSSYFSGFVARVGYDPEFGPRCPPGDNDCLQAGWTWTASVYDSQMNLTYGATRFATVSSDPDKNSGFVFTDLVAHLDVQAGQYGITIMQPTPDPGFCSCMVVPLELNEIAVGEIFSVTYRLEAWAYDSGSHIAPGRYAHAFVQDPLGGNLGISFEMNGLLEVNPGDPTVVPAPAATWLLLAGVLALAGTRRRR